jgi:Recombinase/Recombinase zinc beta ribbon domain
VFCSFLALVLKTTLEDRIAALGRSGSWPDIIADLDSLTETEIEYDGKRFIVRSAPRPAASLAFVKFKELQSARGVMRFLRVSGLPLPVRPLLGPAPHEVVWRDADSARVRHILQNPAYAGAYVYGRPSRSRPGSVTGTVKVAIADWAVCLQAAHPGYIGWEEFMANQRRMADNVARYEAGHAGAPRKGLALLQGVAICGRCGRRMSVRYTGPKADYPVYCCRVDRDQRSGALCQEVRALPVDALGRANAS